MNKLLLLLSFGFGAVITVPDDYSTIQEGIDAAAIGDTVVVYPELYNENIIIDKSITLTSLALFDTTTNTIAEALDNWVDFTSIPYIVINGYINTTIINGAGEDKSTVTVIGDDCIEPLILGFTIQNGNAEGDNPYYSGGGMYLMYSNPALTGVTFSNNTAQEDGGGIDCNLSSNPILTNVTISGNTAGSSGGGGIYSYSSGISLGNVNISDNSTSGPGGGIYYNQSNSILTNVTISGNVATGEYGFGGAIYHETVSYSTLLNCILWNNSPQEIYFSGEIEWNSGSTTAAYCDIQGGEDGIITNDNSTVSWGNTSISVVERLYNWKQL